MAAPVGSVPGRAPGASRLSGPISTVVAMETRVTRDALVAALEASGRIRVEAATASGEETIRAARELHPSVVVLSLRMRDGIVAAWTLRQREPLIKLVALGVDQSEREVLAWAEAGVSGCLVQQASLDDLIGAVEAAEQGKISCSPHVAAMLFGRIASLAAADPRYLSERPALSRREQEIVQLVAAGLSNKQIAHALSLELSTVKNHMNRIFNKLNLRTRAEIVPWANRCAGSEADGACAYASPS